MNLSFSCHVSVLGGYKLFELFTLRSYLVCVYILNCLWISGFDVAKTGDARIGFVGFPSVGKSTLLSNLAGVYSEVAAYEFTTLTTVPGVIRYKGAKIQVLGTNGSHSTCSCIYLYIYLHGTQS